MRRFAIAICILLATGTPVHSADLENLYLTNQWFQLRDAAGPASPDFYRGVIAAAFNDAAGAEHYLGAVLKSGAGMAQRIEAGLLLEQVYARAGRRKAAGAELQRVDSLLLGFTKTSQVDSGVYRIFQQARAGLAALTGYPDQTIAGRGFSRIPYFQIDNQILLPLTINGQPANYYMDTGASESFLNRKEAMRLGLTVHPASIPVEPYGGHSDQTAVGIAVAHDLVIGNMHLRDVPFIVDQDEDHAGVLGLPLLLAFETLRWNSDGTMEIGFPAQPRDASRANLCLDGGRLVTEAAFGSEKVNLFVDTGTPETLLFPTFTRQFSQTVNAAVPEPFDIGETNHDPAARTLSSLTLRVGGADVTAGRIHALSRNFTELGSWAHGNLGTDFAGNARSVTLDFQAMRLTIDGGPASAGSASTCPLPANFVCLAGFACTVRYDPEVRCHIDRIPAGAPAGNVLSAPDDPDPAASCGLPAGFSCAGGESCTAVFTGNGQCRVEHSRAAGPPPSSAEQGTGKLAPSAISPAADPDAREIIERSLKFESLEMAPAKDYVYTDEVVQKLLDADGAVKKTITETHEVMTLYDQEYLRLVSKDGKPLPPAKERAEQVRFDKAVDQRAHESPAAKAKREDAERSRAAHNLVCDSEFLKLFQFRLEGSAEMNGRPAWIVEIQPLPGIAPTCEETRFLSRLHYRVWVDQADFRWTQSQGDNIAPITWGKFLLRVPTGQLHFTFQQRRLSEGVWVASQMDIREDPRVLFANVHIQVIETYSNYRKFQSDSRIVPVK